MTRYLFLCSVGPVQEFIATARRSRDLWYGSWMLNELSKAAAQTIQDVPGATLILPVPVRADDLQPGSDFSVANKVLAVVENTPPDRVAHEVAGSLTVRMRALRDAAFAGIESSYFNKALAHRQIADLPEFYWVSVPYLPGKYGASRNRAEALLAARKNTRNFQQFVGKTVPKSSLDASRESVIDEKAYPNRQENAERQGQKIRHLYRQFGAKRGERLSGVDLLKRLGSRKSFPSTSAVAATPFLHGLGTDGLVLLRNLVAYMHTRWNVDISGNGEDLLFPARLHEYLSDEDALQAREYIENMLDALPEQRRPSPYYAILVADGDGMGETLNGLSDETANRGFSQALSRFSKKAQHIIKMHSGTPVYLGGDDIMTYLPLHTALACLDELQTAFGQALQHYNPQASLSGGLVIAHHLEPLSDVLRLARAAEKEAKSFPGKKALCLVVNKRSGTEWRITSRWPFLLQRLSAMALLHQQGTISRGAAYELQQAYRILSGAGLTSGAMAKEAIRIIRHKKESGGENDLSEEVVQQIEIWLESITVQELAFEMVIAGDFANALTLAGDTPLQEVTA